VLPTAPAIPTEQPNQQGTPQEQQEQKLAALARMIGRDASEEQQGVITNLLKDILAPGQPGPRILTPQQQEQAVIKSAKNQSGVTHNNWQVIR
jgi:hypothetical protein